MTDDELKAEYDAYDKYVQKYCHYKHYKDKEKVIRKRGHYYWGLVSKNKSVEHYSNYIQEMRKFCSNGANKGIIAVSVSPVLYDEDDRNMKVEI